MAGKKIPRAKRAKKGFSPLAWTSKEYRTYKRTIFWYAGVVGVFGVLVGLAVLFGMFFLSIILLLATIVWFRLSFEKPETIRWQVHSDGIKKNGKLIAWESIASFWQNHLGEKKGEIFIQLINGDVLPIHYQKISGRSLRWRLRRFVPEKLRARGHFGETLNRLLKF